MKININKLNNKLLLEKIDNFCNHLEGCRLCMQSDIINGIIISEKKLLLLLLHAIQERKRCIINNPYYNPLLLSSYPYKQDVILKDGLLIYIKNSKKIYQLNNGFKYLLTKSKLNNNNNNNSMVLVDEKLLNNIPTGNNTISIYNFYNSNNDNYYDYFTKY